MSIFFRVSISFLLLFGIMGLDFLYDSLFFVPLYFIPLTLLAVSTSLEFSIGVSLMAAGYLTIKEIFLSGVSSFAAGLIFLVSTVSFSFVVLFLNTLKEKKASSVSKKEATPIKEKSENAYINGVISSYLELLEAKDPLLRKHSTNVANYSRWISKELKLPKEKIQEIYWAALLHDIGKAIIAKGVLNIPPNLMSESEKETYNQHAIISSEIVVQIPGFYNVAKIIRHHHESFNGAGFPEALKAKSIPLGSRVIAVANVYDKLMRSKAYLKTYGANYALEEIKHNYSEGLDITVIEALERAVIGHDDLLKVKKPA